MDIIVMIGNFLETCTDQIKRIKIMKQLLSYVEPVVI
jgi:hypothetical protein